MAAKNQVNTLICPLVKDMVTGKKDISSHVFHVFLCLFILTDVSQADLLSVSSLSDEACARLLVRITDHTEVNPVKNLNQYFIFYLPFFLRAAFLHLNFPFRTNKIPNIWDRIKKAYSSFCSILLLCLSSCNLKTVTNKHILSLPFLFCFTAGW